MGRPRASLVLLLLATLAPRAVQSETERGRTSSVAGRVSDQTGAALPGVSVQLKPADSDEVAETVTDPHGRYQLQAPRPGRYDLRFSLISFSRIHRAVTLEAGAPAEVDVVLPLSMTAEVTVTGRRTFRNPADVDDPLATLIGIAAAASEGAVTARQIEGRPLSRPGDVLETVPGLVLSQHSGEGKANQYYLRGFNLDHGTDFAVSVAGVPVNMPTHGHGQGWADVNFLIPELVSGVQFKKGPYYADEGDFATAGAANINYANVLDRPLLRLTAGGYGFGRLLAAASPALASGHLLLAVEAGRHDGPWENPEDHRRLNGVVRYSRGNTRQGLALTFMGYDATWSATDQVPLRAVASGRLSRFGTLDPSDGGRTHRYTLSADVQRSRPTSTTRVIGYAIASRLNLFSNFTYALHDPSNRDQFEQVDGRRVIGVRASQRRRSRLRGLALEHGVGGQLRHDRIGPLGLFATRDRARLSTTRDDRVRQTTAGIYYSSEIELSDTFRMTSGVRADVYRFDVRSSLPANAGASSAGLVSPKLGVVYAPRPKIELYGNFGYGHHSNDARGATIAVDPATLLPARRVTPLVRTRGRELGARVTMVPKLQTAVAIWGLTLDSELVFAGDAGTTEPGRPSRRFGVEWSNYYTPRPWILLDADLSWSSARFTDDDPSGPYVPGAVRRVASAGVSIHDRHRFSGALRFRYLGARPLVEDGSVRAGRLPLFNAEAAYRLGAGAHVVVGVLNLLDSRGSDVEYYYRSRLPSEPAEGVDDVHFHPVMPRVARVGLQLEF